MCVPLDCLCNGISDCINSDDEIFCIKCLDGCKCVGLAISCEHKIFKIPSNVIHLGYFLFVKMSKSQLLPFHGLNEAEILLLPNNDISEFLDIFVESNFKNLKVLSLHSNKLTTVKYYTRYLQVSNIILLNLSNNVIHKIENNAFASFKLLQVLDLSGNSLSTLTSNNFYGVQNPTVLNLLGNLLLRTKMAAFYESHIQVIFSESFQACCITKSLQIICTYSGEYFNSCNTLLQFLWVKPFVWLFGLSSIVLNSISICTYLSSKSKTVYNLLLISLNTLDIVLAIYLISLGIMDIIYGNTFIENDLFWRHAWLCKLTSIIIFSTQIISCEIVIIMSLSRYIGIKYCMENTFNVKNVKWTIASCAIITFTIVSIIITTNFYLTGKHYLPYSFCYVIASVDLSLPLRVLIGLTYTLFLGSFLLSVSLCVKLVQHINESERTMKQNTVHGFTSKLNTILSNTIFVCVSHGVCYIPLSLILMLSLFTSKFTTYFNVTIVFILFLTISVMNPLIYNFGFIKKIHVSAKNVNK